MDPSLEQAGLTHRTAALGPARVRTLDWTRNLLTTHHLVLTDAGGAGV